jgi:hypothetical protein
MGKRGKPVRGPCGYGRYNDDPQYVGCPYAKSDMTPCIARDGHLALTDPDAPEPVCVGCGHEPRDLLAELGREHEPAAEAERTGDPQSYADRLAELVRQATEIPGT